MDQLNIVTPEAGSTGPNDAALAELGGSLNNAPNPSARPEWLPEGFESPEALAAAYAEMVKNQTPAAAPEGDKPDAPVTPEEGAKDESGDDSVTFEQYIVEALEAGDLTDDQYKELADAGYSRDVVDRYVSSVNTEATQVVNAAYEVAGGEDQYAKMVQWAQASLTKDEIASYNKLTSSGDVNAIKLAVEGLKTKYGAANGSRPGRVISGGNGTNAVNGYTSWAEVTSAMADPRYSTDPAYRQQVTQRIQRSGNLA